MKKFYLLMLSLFLSSAVAVNAQTLLDEDFEHTRSETATTVLPDGWTAVTSYTGSHTGYRWTIGHNNSASSTMSGYYYAYCDAPTYDKGDNDGTGPRKDMIITPAMNLDNTYQLAFDWEAAAAACLKDKAMTLQVAIIDMAAPSDTTVIFDIQNEEDVRNSGVPADPYGSYLWGNWQIHNSKIDLDAYQGKTIKIAFIYNLQKKVANIVYLDNISVKYHKSLSGPIAELAQSRYEFPEMYIGEKRYSEVIKLKNVGKKGLKITGFDAPECVGINSNAFDADLGINETVDLQFSYKAGFTTPAETDAVIHTNGGDVTIHLVASKMAVPDGYELELFEGNQFAPAGWKNNGWRTAPYAIEGDLSAMASGDYQDDYLTTPRLDLSKPETPHKFMFSYYSMFPGENSPYNDLSVEVSTDLGETFKQVWIADYAKIDTLINVEVDLSDIVSDSVLIRFKNSAIQFDENGADEWTTFLLDRVLLPGVYGIDGVPTAAEVVTPTNGAKDIYTKNVELKWLEAQFAEGYKVYATTTKGQWDLANGVDVGTETSYKIAQIPYATTIYWKVVPYNSVGDAADVPVWAFTSQDDHSVKEFPWTEDFNGETFAPLGWNAENEKYTWWRQNTSYSYEGKACAMAQSNETEKNAYLYSPDITIPAEGEYQLSFWWANAHPADLVKDLTSVHVNNTTQDDGIDAVFLEIWSDGAWKQVRLISNNVEKDGNYYWCYESVDLTEYAGKNIQLRWRYTSHNYSKARSAGLDLVKIEPKAAQVSFSADHWDAYKVNYAEQATSPTFALSNLGSVPVTITKVEFDNPAFNTSLKAGTEIAANSSKQFTVSFVTRSNNAEPVELNDNMTLTLSDGNSIELPVKATAMPRDYMFYGFENDATGASPAGFTPIDVDGQATVTCWSWTVPNMGAPLSMFVLNDSQCNAVLKEPHGHQSLMSRCNNNGGFNDWLVSEKMMATSASKFTFDARTWESVNSILPASGIEVGVYVSEIGGTKTTNYTQVDYKKLDLYNNTNWDNINVDLSAYAGKEIYVAVQAYSSNCLGGFLDNFEFQHFTKYDPCDINHDGSVDIADVNIVINTVLGMGSNEYNCDINGDDDIDIADINRVINAILGL